MQHELWVCFDTCNLQSAQSPKIKIRHPPIKFIEVSILLCLRTRMAPIPEHRSFLLFHETHARSCKIVICCCQLVKHLFPKARRPTSQKPRKMWMRSEVPSVLTQDYMRNWKIHRMLLYVSIFVHPIISLQFISVKDKIFQILQLTKSTWLLAKPRSWFLLVLFWSATWDLDGQTSLFSFDDPPAMKRGNWKNILEKHLKVGRFPLSYWLPAVWQN